MRRRFISCLFFLPAIALCGTLYAQQPCNCPEAVTENGNEYLAEKLLASNTFACRSAGCELLAKEMLKKKEFDSAVQLLDKAAAWYKKNNCEEAAYLSLYKLYTNLYHNKADFQSSLQYNLKILSIAESTGNMPDRANALLVVAEVFNRLKQFEKGIQYTRTAIPVVQKLAASGTKGELLNRITARYFFYANATGNTRYADTAEIFVQQALAVSKDAHDVKGQVIALTRMNDIAAKRKDYQKALAYIDAALAMCETGVHNSQLATLYGDKGDVLMNTGDFTEAARYADSFLHYCRLDAFPPMIANAYNLKYEIEYKAGNYKVAMEAMQHEKQITDSITSEERTKAVTELEKKYSQVKNENIITELSQQKKIYLLLAAAGLLGLIAVWFFSRQRSLRQKQKILETEQRLNRARMNPHFFFNALATLQSFALRENDGKVLAGNLSKFSHIMRETLESTYKDYVTIEQETEFLNEYMELQKIRFPEKFTYSVHSEEDMETDELQVPSMIVQPFIENSIEHGFSGINYPGHISVFFSREKENIVITITDNGKGMQANAKENDEHISRASQIIKDRIYLLNIKLKSKAGFSIDNNPAGIGVMVKIMLPVMYK
ncbi:MAG: histidine kinase [Ferruginibacter sp.]